MQPSCLVRLDVLGTVLHAPADLEIRGTFAAAAPTFQCPGRETKLFSGITGLQQRRLVTVLVSFLLEVHEADTGLRQRNISWAWRAKAAGGCGTPCAESPPRGRQLRRLQVAAHGLPKRVLSACATMTCPRSRTICPAEPAWPRSEHHSENHHDPSPWPSSPSPRRALRAAHRQYQVLPRPTMPGLAVRARTRNVHPCQCLLLARGVRGSH